MSNRPDSGYLSGPKPETGTPPKPRLFTSANPLIKYAFTDEQREHAPRAFAQAFERNLCACAGYGDHICEMYDGHERDLDHLYRREHHCECGRSWDL